MTKQRFFGNFSPHQAQASQAIAKKKASIFGSGTAGQCYINAKAVLVDK